MKKYFSVLKILSAVLAFVLFVGCGSKTVVVKPEEKVLTETFTETVPGEEAEYTSSTIYDYYDDQYTTTPGVWSTIDAKQRTVQNLASYSFDEKKYLDVTYSGGTDIRTEDFVRGMGCTQYHATEGWQISAATIALDTANFKELNVNSKRNWGEGTGSIQSSNYSHASNLSIPLDKTIYADGKTAQLDYIFSAFNAVELISNKWISTLSKPGIVEQNKLIMLGNEYRNHLTNSSGAYAHAGYDDITLNNFRNNWLKTRFGTISNLNKLCGTNYSSFAQIVPAKSNPKLFYEFWNFLRETFRTTFENAVNIVDSKISGINWGYAGIDGYTDPYGSNLYLDFLDYSSQNHYPNWYENLFQYSFQTDNLVAWSLTAPAMITEVGYTNGLTEETQQKAARNYKQVLNTLYMRPRVVGSYIFNYTSSAPDIILNDDTWGMVKPDRTRYQSFDSVAQVYTDFKYLDGIYNGASNTPLVAISNQVTTEEIINAEDRSSKVAALLYSQGVPVQVVPSDDSTRFDGLKQQKLIFNDIYMYQNPDGIGDVAKSLVDYMNKGGNILRTEANLPQKLYGIGSEFTASSNNDLSNKYKNLTFADISVNAKQKYWNTLADFIHGDFVSGKVSVAANTVDENAARVLEVNGYNNNGIGDPTWDIQTQMVYKNGEMYLCIVNTGEKAIENVDVTIGVNDGVLCNLNPRLVRGDSNVSVSRPERANVPSFIENVEDCKVSLGTVHISNLDTYAYIYVGKAILK